MALVFHFLAYYCHVSSYCGEHQNITSPFQREKRQITRFFIFLIGGMCIGISALIWACRVLYHHRKAQGSISAFIIFLLLNDLTELLLSPYIVTYLLQRETFWDAYSPYRIFSSLWSSSRICGVNLHQLVALESILSLRLPQCSAHLFSSPCSITASIIFNLIMLLGEIFFNVDLEFVLLVSNLFLLLVMILVSCFITCTAPRCSANNVDRPLKADLTVLAVAMFNGLILYLPFLTLSITFLFSDLYVNHTILVLWVMSASLVNLRVISDSILCVLVCRENHRIQTPLRRVQP